MNNNSVCMAGFSQIDITPDYPVTLVGRYRPENSQGILHRLYAQSLLFQRRGESYCLVSIDNLGLTVPLSNKIRLKIAGLLGTDISHVMLNFSHTHSAPEPTPNGCNGERYFDFLINQITACVEDARKNYRPCKIGWSLTESETGENRRDGGTATDNRLGALMIADANEDKPIVLAARIATHNNILPSANLYVSNDFMGIARDELQKDLGYPVMFLQGAAGNIKAVGTNLYGEGDDGVLRKVSDTLINSVKSLRFDLQEITDIRMLSEEITCISDTPSKEYAEKIARGNDFAAEWLKACEELREKGIYSQNFPVEINFLKINQGCLCGVAYEIFCELALEAAERTGNQLLFLNGYTNGCMGYLPNLEEWHKGGYEVIESNFGFYKYFGRVMPFRAETAGQITDTVVNVINAFDL